jgi:hypothetical protein
MNNPKRQFMKTALIAIALGILAATTTVKAQTDAPGHEPQTLNGYELGQSFETIFKTGGMTCYAQQQAEDNWNRAKHHSNADTPPHTSPDCMLYNAMLAKPAHQQNVVIACYATQLQDVESPCLGFNGAMIFKEGTLSRIYVWLDSYEDGVATGTKKYGEPTVTDAQKVQNKIGAQSKLRSAYWRSDDTVVTIEEGYNGGRIRIMATLETFAEFAAKHQQESKDVLVAKTP